MGRFLEVNLIEDYSSITEGYSSISKVNFCIIEGNSCFLKDIFISYANDCGPLRRLRAPDKDA